MKKPLLEKGFIVKGNFSGQKNAKTKGCGAPPRPKRPGPGAAPLKSPALLCTSLKIALRAALHSGFRRMLFCAPVRTNPGAKNRSAGAGVASRARSRHATRKKTAGRPPGAPPRPLFMSATRTGFIIISVKCINTALYISLRLIIRTLEGNGRR